MPTLHAKITRNGWWLVALALFLIVLLLAVDHQQRQVSDLRVRSVLTHLCDVRTMQAQATIDYAEREAAIERSDRFIDAPMRTNRLASAARLAADLEKSQASVDCTSISSASGPAAER